MTIEAALDWTNLLLLIFGALHSVPMVVGANGRRPLLVLVFVMGGLWGWAGVDGLGTEQDWAQHIRRHVAAVSLIGAVEWAARRGGR